MKLGRIYFCVFTLITSLIVACVDPGHRTSSPNIIVFLIDDAGYADFGFMDCEDLATPNIDRLAAGGMIFTDAHVSANLLAVPGAPQSEGSSSFSSSYAGDGISYKLTSQHEVQTATDAGGAFELFVEPAPEISVGGWSPGFDYTHVTVDPADPSPVTIRLPRKVRLVGGGTRLQGHVK